MFRVPSVGTNFHKQNSAFLGFYESGSRRLLRVSGVGLLYLFQLRVAPKIKIQRG
jgi:hypothetical protein